MQPEAVSSGGFPRYPSSLLPPKKSRIVITVPAGSSGENSATERIGSAGAKVP